MYVCVCVVGKGMKLNGTNRNVKTNTQACALTLKMSRMTSNHVYKSQCSSSGRSFSWKSFNSKIT